MTMRMTTAFSVGRCRLMLALLGFVLAVGLAQAAPATPAAAHAGCIPCAKVDNGGVVDGGATPDVINDLGPRNNRGVVYH